MLTDTKLRNIKPQDKLYKVNDRDGLYVAVTSAGAISFRYNYSINGRQETITFGRYGTGGNPESYEVGYYVGLSSLPRCVAVITWTGLGMTNQKVVV